MAKLKGQFDPVAFADPFELFQDKDQRVAIVRQKPMLFVQTYLSEYLQKRLPDGSIVPCKSGLFHLEMVDHWLDQRVIQKVARGHAKSFLEMARLLWMICTNPDGGGGRQILYLTSPQVVRRIIKQLSTELMTNKLILHDFGRLLDDTCTIKTENEPEIVTLNGWQILSKSVKSALRGLRPDEIDIDDVLDREEAKSPDLRQKAFEVFYNDVEPMLLPGTRKRFSGTPMHPEDLIEREFESDKWNWKGLFPCWYEDIDGHKHPQWPDMFTVEDLYRKKAEMDFMSPGSFQQEYELVPFLAANALWSGINLQFWERRPPHNDMYIVTGVDLASGLSEENSETAIVSMGGLIRTTDWGNQGTFWELKADIGHFKSLDVVNRLIQHCEEFNFRNKVVVENKAWHNTLKEVFEAELQRRGYSMPSFEFAKAGPGEDKATRAESIIHFYRDKLVYHDPNGRIKDQLKLFTGRKRERNDAVDATVYALRHFLGKKWIKTRHGKITYVHKVNVYDRLYGTSRTGVSICQRG